MIERIADMPAGTIGLRASGKLTRDEYRQVLEPALQEGVDSGAMRIVFVLTDYDGIELAAVPEDLKTGLTTWIGHHSAWKRFALVTDVQWVAKAMELFTWMVPGEVMIYKLDGLDEAKDWAAGGDDR